MLRLVHTRCHRRPRTNEAAAEPDATATPAGHWACLSRMRGQRARPVLRGPRRSNAPGLPDELVGEFANKGTEYQPGGEPVRVKTHDFVDKQLGRAVPYGVYDISNDEGWVSVGGSADTASFAVEAIRRWWCSMGLERFPRAKRLLITADAGGSNGYRVRLWKLELAALAKETGLDITVCHYPPGTSKWNKIEHRMFSFISMNWRGRPLVSYRTIIELIAATTTATGLTVRADEDLHFYEKGRKVSDAELAAVPLTRHQFHGDWNYTLLTGLTAQSNDR